ncbi:MAG: right-handed parallel beta-helix repeat-containing protein [Candidatus Nitrosocosmicus sp.]
MNSVIDSQSVKSQQQIIKYSPQNKCIRYSAIQLNIIVTCKSATLTDIYNQLKNPVVLTKQPNGVWALNANITINPGATLTIDPKDTTWLKIIADEKSLAYGIHVKGSLKIDSVKVSSWNPFTNNFAMSNGSRERGSDLTRQCGHSCSIEVKDTLTHHGAPRPFIMIEPKATGTTNITNSYIGYLGYEAGWGKKAEGLHYNGGDGSIVRNNNIDHLYFGFYSVGVGNMLIENNIIHDSGHYGIDPHTGTHDMIIRNNTVYNNNGTAIICSLDCYNIIFEANKIHNNNGAGISFSRNTNNSIARNNIIDHQVIPIELTSSHNDDIYNNLITNTDTPAISVKANSTDNKIYYNTIKNSAEAIKVEPTSKNNLIYSNSIINTPPSSTITTQKNTIKTTTTRTSAGVGPNADSDAATPAASAAEHQKQTTKKHSQQQQTQIQLEPAIAIPHSLPAF